MNDSIDVKYVLNYYQKYSTFAGTIVYMFEYIIQRGGPFKFMLYLTDFYNTEFEAYEEATLPMFN